MKLIFVCCGYQAKHLLFRVDKDFDVQSWANRNANNFKLLGITHIEVEEIS